MTFLSQSRRLGIEKSIKINQHAWVLCHLMLSCSQAPCPEPRTLIPSSQTACIDWLPLYTTSRGEMGRPSLYICQEWGSATVELGANCTHMACDTCRYTYRHILINLLIDISHGFSLMFKWRPKPISALVMQWAANAWLPVSMRFTLGCICWPQTCCICLQTVAKHVLHSCPRLQQMLVGYHLSKKHATDL